MAGRASGIKMGGDRGGSLVSANGEVTSWIVGVSASVIFPHTIKSRRFLLAPAHLGSPGKRAIVCVYNLTKLFYKEYLTTAHKTPSESALTW